MRLAIEIRVGPADLLRENSAGTGAGGHVTPLVQATMSLERQPDAPKTFSM